MEQSNTSLRERARKAREEADAYVAKREAEAYESRRERAVEKLIDFLKELDVTVHPSSVQAGLVDGSLVATACVEDLTFQWEAAGDRFYLIGICPKCHRVFHAGRPAGSDALVKLHDALISLDNVLTRGDPCPWCIEDEKEAEAAERAEQAATEPLPDRNPTLAEQLEAAIVRIVRRELSEQQ